MADGLNPYQQLNLDLLQRYGSGAETMPNLAQLLRAAPTGAPDDADTRQRAYLLNRMLEEQLLQQMETAAAQRAHELATWGATPTSQQQYAEWLKSMAQTQAMLPILQERAKGEEERKTLAAQLETATKLRSGAATQPSATPPSAETPPVQGPVTAPSWWALLTGKGEGAVPHGDLLSLAQARSERAKYDLGFPTPFANLAQITSLEALQQIQGMFPGIRGIQNLLNVFAQHQANWGHETPAATYQRLAGMYQLLGTTEESLDDPEELYRMTASGKITVGQIPQSMERAKSILHATRQGILRGMAFMRQQYPGIEQAVSTVETGAPTPSPTATTPTTSTPAELRRRFNY